MGQKEHFRHEKRRLAVLCLFALSIVGSLLIRSAWAQEKPSSQAQVAINQIDSSSFPQIKLFVSVQDSSGIMIRNLESKDFVVTEDEVEQSPIAVETQLPPISTVLVVDTSGSMKPAIADTKRAASSYVDLAKAGDEMLLITFSDRVITAQGFSSDKSAIKKALEDIKARGNTALYDAVYQAVKSSA
ncbi:MAG: VWA domain-containing protein [Desulfosoma sp.]